MYYSEEYLRVLRLEHQQTKWGLSGVHYSQCVIDKCKEYSVNKILDYGSGQGLLKQNLEPTINVTNYDPGIENFSIFPEPHDIVVCFDVLEHIEYDYIDNVLKHISNLTNKLAMVTIAYNAAGRILNDGRNAHLIIENHDWWKAKLLNFFNIDQYQYNIFYIKPLKKSL